MRFSFGTSCRLTQASANVSALPGGNGNGSSFNNVGNNGNWWSSTENNATNAWNRNMNYNNSDVNRNNNNKTNLYSVRCVQDCYGGSRGRGVISSAALFFKNHIHKKGEI